jgi:hypothetical protein
MKVDNNSQPLRVAHPEGDRDSGLSGNDSQLTAFESAVTTEIAPIGAIQQAGIPTKSIEDLPEEQLKTLITGLWTGFRRNRHAIAEALLEKKSRLVRRGCKGEWSSFLRSVEIPRNSADRLVRGYELNLRISPLLRNAAERKGIDLMKPSVIRAMQCLQDGVFDLDEEQAKEKMPKWLEILTDAAKGRPSLDYRTDTEPSFDLSLQTPIEDNSACEDSDEEDEVQAPGSTVSTSRREKKEEKHPKTLALTTAELLEFKLLVQKCGDEFELEKDEDIVLQALRVASAGFSSTNS